MKRALILLLGFCLVITILVSSAYSGSDFSNAKSLPLEDGTIRFENVLINGTPFWMTYKCIDKGRLIPIQFGRLSTFQIPKADIIIDGDQSDWSGISPIYLDSASDQDLPNGHIGTDVQKFYIATDGEFLYCAFILYDGNPPQDGTMFVTELQQYLNQYHTAGDTTLNAHWREGNGWMVILSYREIRGVTGLEYGSDHVAVGSKFIEYKVPIADIEYDGGGLFDPMGIEGRFIRSYVHYAPDSNGDGIPDEDSTYDGVSEDNRLMIVDFY